MGLLSKLIKKAGSELVADKLVKDVVNAADKAIFGNSANSAAQRRETTQTWQPQQRRDAWEPEDDGPSGFSWGPRMPEEENQFNSGLPYAEYFERIFRTDFADCQVTREARGPKSTLFTFYRGGQRALVVELLSKSSSAYAVRKQCRSTGTPYLRYYYDYHGWWNTRAYVVSRTRAALGG